MLPKSPLDSSLTWIRNGTLLIALLYLGWCASVLRRSLEHGTKEHNAYDAVFRSGTGVALQAGAGKPVE